jgi:hypothetical protein
LQIFIGYNLPARILNVRRLATIIDNNSFPSL